MKRLIAAVSFAVLAAPAFAVEVGLPYDQSLVDRALPQIPERGDAASSGQTSRPESVWANDYHFIAPAQ